MKRLTLLLSAMLLTASTYAQQPPGPPPRGGSPVEMLSRRLGLDDTQKAEVKRIFEEERTRHEAERKQWTATGQRPDPATMKTLMQQHDTELVNALSGVLTADQLAKFKTWQAERRERMRDGAPPGMHPGPQPAQ
jgi:Spy/CpxP family protein refolding chaperone